MKPGAGLVPMLLGLALLPLALPAGEGTEPAKQPKTLMQNQVHSLIRAEAGIFIPPPVETDETGPETVAGETLQLEPMIIEEPKLKRLPPPETKAEKFFRTGTIWEKVGPRFTKQFWVGRGQGIGFTLSW